MKKIIKYVSIICLFILLTGCGNTKKSNIKEITLDEFKDKITNKESFVVYIGNEDCSHCQSYKPTLEKVLNDYDITIYHIDNSKLSDKEYGEFKNYVSISGTPTVAFITEGEEESALNRIVGQTDEETTIKRFKANGYIK